MGQILLPVKIGDAEHFTSTWMNIMVVRSPSSYNGILRRPGVRKIQTVPSTAHRMLKFPVPGGILTPWSNRIIPLECTMVSGPEAQPSDIIQAAKERIKVAIHQKYPEQTIAIGPTLTKEGRKALWDLLRRNLDIFAWKPVDITWVPWHIAEHILNVHEGCSPVKQKKRSHALERTKAIQEEVEKLVDVGIMKEVHYYSWLSKPLNARATYQRVVDKAFQEQISRNLELNPKKCTFGIEEGMFLGYKVNTKGIQTMEEEAAFKQMKKLLAELPTLIAPMEKEELIVYLAAAKEAVSAVLMTEREAKQMPIYFVSRVLQDDFRAGLILTNLEGTKFTYALRFRFDATNNEAEFEALIIGLRITKQRGIKNLQANVDSWLVANQVNGTYIAKELGMIQYLEKVKTLASNFRKFSIKQVPRSENKKADALSKMASTSFAHLTKQVLVE
ncbi:reverse transcriptase domain-containing protein [Tanacetum coccineum]